MSEEIKRVELKNPITGDTIYPVTHIQNIEGEGWNVDLSDYFTIDYNTFAVTIVNTEFYDIIQNANGFWFKDNFYTYKTYDTYGYMIFDSIYSKYIETSEVNQLTGITLRQLFFYVDTQGTPAIKYNEIKIPTYVDKLPDSLPTEEGNYSLEYSTTSQSFNWLKKE